MLIVTFSQTNTVFRNDFYRRMQYRITYLRELASQRKELKIGRNSVWFVKHHGWKFVAAFSSSHFVALTLAFCLKQNGK